MFRLYLSLYLTCALCLGISAWFLETHYTQEDAFSQLEQDLISLQLRQHSFSGPSLSNAPQVNIIPIASLYLSQEMTQQLFSGQTLSLVDNKQQWYFYQLHPDQKSVVTLGPLAAQYNHNDSLIKFIFYLSIAIAVFLGSWPLFRDLKRLRLGSEAISQGKFDTKIRFSRFSMVKDIGDAFNHMSNQLNRRATTQRELINAVSHDFLTPISRAKFAVEVHDDEHCSTLSNDELLQDLVELEVLVEEFLTYAEFQQCKPQFVYEQHCVDELLHHCVEKFSAYNNIDIHYHSQCATITADQRSFVRILQNLLGNAVRFAKSRINVEITCEKDYWQLSVADDGIGIDDAKKASMLQPFQQDAKGNEQIYQGVGLGLAIVRQLCDWQQATLIIDHCPVLKGASLQVRLPYPTTKQTL